AEHETIYQVGVRRRRRVRHGVISVRPAERIQPARRMEDGGPRVSLNQPRPASIANGINLIDGHGRVALPATARSDRALLTWPTPASRSRPVVALSGPGEWRSRSSLVAGDFLRGFLAEFDAPRREEVVQGLIPHVPECFERCLFGEVVEVSVDFPPLQEGPLAQDSLHAQIQGDMKYLQFAPRTDAFQKAEVIFDVLDDIENQHEIEHGIVL